MSSEFEFDPTLLDLHLGVLSTAEQSSLRHRVAADPRLQRQDEALAAVFTALHAAREAPLATPNLVGAIMQRIDQAGPAPRIVRPADGLTRQVERDGRLLFRMHSVRD